jgi:hypothetical protein
MSQRLLRQHSLPLLRARHGHASGRPAASGAWRQRPDLRLEVVEELTSRLRSARAVPRFANCGAAAPALRWRAVASVRADWDDKHSSQRRLVTRRSHLAPSRTSHPVLSGIYSEAGRCGTLDPTTDRRHRGIFRSGGRAPGTKRADNVTTSASRSSTTASVSVVGVDFGPACARRGATRRRSRLSAISVECPRSVPSIFRPSRSSTVARTATLLPGSLASWNASVQAVPGTMLAGCPLCATRAARYASPYAAPRETVRSHRSRSGWCAK